ncbi:MAG TPA: iduronate sulfatase [Solibacterales bacterium]|nr:iduronate sulfatase [Bryobacterales bacterium]
MITRRAFAGSLLAPLVAHAAARRLNVLLITVDDLRPQLGCYGDPQVKSPHIDALASSGLVFERAYTQQALCAPSRTALLTGLRPDTTRVYDIVTHFRSTVPDAVTLPQLFKNHGYHSQGFYKVFHLAGFDPGLGNLDDPPSWSEPLYLPQRSVYGPEGEAVLKRAYARFAAEGKKPSYAAIPRSFAFEAPDVPDEALSDGEVAVRAVQALERRRGQPFFLACGFYKPHLPFVAPKRYWDLYREDDLVLPNNQYPPDGAPPWAMVGDTELRTYEGIPKQGPYPEKLKRQVLHGYLASISYADAQVGKVLAALRRLGLEKDTLVVLLGDHGYQVGEHGSWATKQTNFETSVRAPLIVRAPGMKAAGQKSKALVEFVDIYPAIAELCGLRGPSSLEGRSFRPLLDNPALPWKAAAYSQYPRGQRMGRSVTDGRFRYTEWVNRQSTVEGVELYDHDTDPHENVNQAASASMAAARVRMKRLLDDGNWRSFQ